MSFDRLSSVVRVLVFYFLALMLLLLFSFTAQRTLGLPGVILMHLMVFLGLPVFFTLQVERKPLRQFLRIRLLSPKGFLKALFLGFISWLTAQTMGTVIVLLLRQLGGQMVQPYQILLDAPAWLALLAGALVPAITEEISFRGYVLGALRPLGPTAAVLLTGLLFGALHLSLIRLIPLALLGILWAMVVQRSGSILPGMIMHFLNNGIALGLTFLLRGQANPADLDALNAFPPAAIWVAIGAAGLMALGFALAAYFTATTFGPGDLARPEEAAEGDLPSQPEEQGLADPEQLPPELQELESELVSLQRRRRLLLQAVGLLAGLISLSLFLLVAIQEVYVAFR
ncbi:MAG: CPBP family intramembrane glutamic endopeptidase [Bacillota bacterium]